MSLPRVFIPGFFSALLLLAGAPADAATQPLREGIPDAAAQAKARVVIQKVFKDELARKSVVDRRKLAATYLKQAAEPGQEVANCFVLLADGAELAASAADVVTALAAVDQLAARFDLGSKDVMGRKVAAIIKAERAANRPADFGAIAVAACDLMQQTLLSDDFTTGQELSGIAEGAGDSSKNVSLVTTLKPKLAEYKALMAEFVRAQTARKALATAPGDADAHLALGRYLALVKNDWAAGLPELAAGSDETLRAAALLELKKPPEAVTQIYLGDCWWEASLAYSGLKQSALRAHARTWYMLAKAEGLSVARTESRIADPSAVTPLAPTAGADALGAVSADKSVDLLPLIDTGVDGVMGLWKMGDHALTVGKSKYARITIPYEAAEEYDFVVEFTRTDGNGSITMLLHANGASFGWSMGVKSSAECRFETVGRKIDEGNPTIVQWELESDKKHIVLVQVRKDFVAAWVDGKKMSEWKTNYKDLTRYLLWKMPDEKKLGLGANNAAVTFSSVEIKEVTGEGKKGR